MKPEHGTVYRATEHAGAIRNTFDVYSAGTRLESLPL
jgi:hypothetical protein